MKVEVVAVDSLELDPNNARRHDKRNLDAIAGSLREFGQRKPIVVWRNRVVAGNGTLVAARSLGWGEISVARCPDDWDEVRVKAFALADNRSAELASWDEQVLTAQLKELELAEFDVEAIGFDLVVEPEPVVEDEIPEVVETKVKLGQVWQLGRHRLMCGDSTVVDAVAKLMNGNKADLVLTDPPYGMFLDTDWSDIKGSLKSAGLKSKTSGKKYDKVIGDNEDFTDTLITSIFDNFSNVKEVFLFGADYFAELLPEKNNGSWLVWDKRKPNQEDAIGAEFELLWSKQKHKRRVLRHDWFGFLSSSNPLEARNRVHPTQKPTSLLVDVMQQWGKINDIVVDVFGGSGSTLIACEQTNRVCYMMELDPKYCDVIIARWEKLTGETAVLVEG